MEIQVAAYDVPTEAPESDGTAEWSKTTLVVVELKHGGKSGLGYTYADAATARIVRDLLAPQVGDFDPFDTGAPACARWPSRRSTSRPGT